MRRVDDQDIGPLDQPPQNALRLGRLQIERQSALVAIVEVPGIVVLGARLRRDLVSYPPGIAGRRFDLDHVGAEVGQDHRGSRTRDEARQVHHLQSGENVVACHGSSFLNCRVRRVFFTVRGIVARAFRGRQSCLPSCPRLRRRARSRRPRAAGLRFGSSPSPCLPPRART